MIKSATLYWIALLLTIIGGLNWGLVGLFNADLIGSISALARIIYILVGLSACYCLYIFFLKQHVHF